MIAGKNLICLINKQITGDFLSFIISFAVSTNTQNRAKWKYSINKDKNIPSCFSCLKYSSFVNNLDDTSDTDNHNMP